MTKRIRSKTKANIGKGPYCLIDKGSDVLSQILYKINYKATAGLIP